MTTDSPSTVSSATVLDEQEARALLAQTRAENEADLASAKATLESLNADHTLVDSGMTDVVASAQHMIDDAETILAEVAKAEARLDAGTYGKCTQCGQPVNAERLRLRPYVRLCIACA